MPRPRQFLALWLLSLFVGAANALHFYLDADEKRCFLEEVPSETVVEGQLPALPVFRFTFLTRALNLRRTLQSSRVVRARTKVY